MPNITPVSVTVDQTTEPWTLIVKDSLINIYSAAEAQIIQWNLELTGGPNPPNLSLQSGTFDAITFPMTAPSGFSWIAAGEEAQADPFSVAVRINDNMSILIVNFHNSASTQTSVSYMLCATVVDEDGDSHACQTNPQAASGIGTAGQPCIQNN